MAWDCAQDLKKYDVAFVSLWPGLVRTEKMEAARDEFVARSKSVECI